MASYIHVCMEKKSILTDTVHIHVVAQNMHTDKMDKQLMDKMDKRSEYDHPNTRSTGVLLTHFPTGVDKCVALDPVISRHVQTEVVKSIHKKVGCNKTCSTTQSDSHMCQELSLDEFSSDTQGELLNKLIKATATNSGLTVLHMKFTV